MDIFVKKGLNRLIQEGNEKYGIKGNVQVIIEAIKSKKIPAGEFSFSELWETFVGTSRHEANFNLLKEAIEPTAFPTITRQLISSELIDGYQSTEKVSDKLVTTFSSNLELDKIAGFTGTSYPTKLLPGEAYPKASFEEKYTQVGYEKYGQEIDITEEAVKFDQTGKILMAARDIGEGTAVYEERFVMRKIIDADSDVYKPSGTATALYTAGNNNLKTSNGLSDDTNLTAAYIQFNALCVGDDKDTRPVLVPNDIMVLVPRAKMFLLNKILESTGNPGSANLGVNQFGKNALTRLGLTVTPVHSQFLDASSATNWYMGAFKKQFVKKIVFPFSMQDLPGDAHKDIILTYKTRFAIDVGAKDTKYVVKCTN